MKAITVKSNRFCISIGNNNAESVKSVINPLPKSFDIL